MTVYSTQRTQPVPDLATAKAVRSALLQDQEAIRNG
jgi:hypothetical protein